MSVLNQLSKLVDSTTEMIYYNYEIKALFMSLLCGCSWSNYYWCYYYYYKNNMGNKLSQSKQCQSLDLNIGQ